MAQNNTKTFRLFGSLAGEMQVSDIPTAPGVDIEALKAGDEDPLEVIVEVPASKSKRGWNYTANSLRDIVNAVNTNTLNGFLGHQKAEDVSNQFLPPVTHWVGAKLIGESAFFRGVVDAAAKDLKRWIKSGRIRQVSIFGMPQLQESMGETNVVGYEPLSIDWTPLDRAGMQTRIVALSGEMWDIDGKGPEKQEGGVNVTPEELLAKAKEMLQNKQITVSMIAGEMGWKAEQIAQEIDADWAKGVLAKAEKLDEVHEALGISGEMDIVKVAEDAAKALEAQKGTLLEKAVGEMMETKVTSEAARNAIINESTALGKLWSYHAAQLGEDATKDDISGEMDKFLADTAVKSLISTYHTDNPIRPGGTSGNESPKNLVIKKVSI